GVDGLADAANALRLPFVSGNVSLYNTSAGGNAVPASPIVACVGTVADISRVATSALKAAGSKLFLIGARSDALGGSIVATAIEDASRDALAAADPEAAGREIALLLDAYANDLVLAAHDISDGGLAVTVSEMAFGAAWRALGARIDASRTWAPSIGEAGAWFGESGGFVVEVADAARFESLAGKHGVPVSALGAVTGDARLVLGDVSFEVGALREAWEAPLRGFYDPPEDES
ncbi:MAG: AIR synthase-related protein, partial [Vulcanimicrobiaceae bacterium]